VLFGNKTYVAPNGNLLEYYYIILKSIRRGYRTYSINFARNQRKNIAQFPQYNETDASITAGGALLRDRPKVYALSHSESIRNVLCFVKQETLVEKKCRSVIKQRDRMAALLVSVMK